jgi:hypothetical protein
VSVTREKWYPRDSRYQLGTDRNGPLTGRGRHGPLTGRGGTLNRTDMTKSRRVHAGRVILYVAHALPFSVKLVGVASLLV